MAKTPKLPANNEAEARQSAQNAEHEMLMREVDEAVRQDQVSNVMRNYGLAIGGALLLGLAAFGGYLFWDHQREAAREEVSEQLITAIDELEAGNLAVADQKLTAIETDGGAGAAASASMMRAGIALQQKRDKEALVLFKQVAANADAPQPYRDAALVRAVALEFDDLDPQQVIDRLGPLAVADSPWFGSAGEMVAMAYLQQNKPKEAGPLLAKIAQDEKVPGTLRSRTRQLAGLLGYDAVTDVEATLAEVQGGAPQGQPASAPAPAQ